MVLQELKEKGLINPPPFVLTNTMYITISGSISYGVADTSVKNKPSDFDCVGFCIPPRDYLFPHLRSEIIGFGTPGPTFGQFQKHHIFDPTANGGKGREYDFVIYNIVKLFQLCYENNPNCIDVLFTPIECVIHNTETGNLLRENRKLFLSKRCFKKFKGFAYSQLHKMEEKNPEGNRKEIRDRFGFDVKYAYNLVRLLLEVEMILTEGDLDLQRNKEHLKAIRRGDIKVEDIKKWFTEKELQLEKIHAESKLPEHPPEAKIKKLLLNCIEAHYGTIQGFEEKDWAVMRLREIDKLISEDRNKLYN